MRRVGYRVDLKRTPLVKGRNQKIVEDELGVERLPVQAAYPCGHDTVPGISRCWQGINSDVCINNGWYHEGFRPCTFFCIGAKTFFVCG